MLAPNIQINCVNKTRHNASAAHSIISDTYVLYNNTSQISVLRCSWNKVRVCGLLCVTISCRVTHCWAMIIKWIINTIVNKCLVKLLNYFRYYLYDYVPKHRSTTPKKPFVLESLYLDKENSKKTSQLLLISNAFWIPPKFSLKSLFNSLTYDILAKVKIIFIIEESIHP